MAPTDGPSYGTDLALIHHRGFGFHADGCAPGIAALLEPVRARAGLVLELGCGSGALTRHLVDQGHRVIASDASPAMLELARGVVPDAEEVREIVLPDDRLPDADAIVSVGHVLSYLPDEEAIERAFVSIARALRPGGVLAVDLCDLRWGQVRGSQSGGGVTSDDWAIIWETTETRPDRYVRDITTFVRSDDGTWRRGQERHRTVLLDTDEVPRLLARHGVEAKVQSAFGTSALPDGLVAIIGRRQP